MPNYDHPVTTAERELAKARATLRADPDFRPARMAVEAAERAVDSAKRHRDRSLTIDAERAAAREQREQAAVDALKNEHRQRYLAQPGASEADFEREWPTLLADHRRDEARNGHQRLRDEARTLPRYRQI